MKELMLKKLNELLENDLFIDVSDGDKNEIDVVLMECGCSYDDYENYQDEYASLLDYLNDNYKSVSSIDSSGHVTLYYYYNSFTFNTTNELENHFQMGK